MTFIYKNDFSERDSYGLIAPDVKEILNQRRISFSGPTAMDIRSSVSGDISDDSMFTRAKGERKGQTRLGFFDPAAPSSKSYLINSILFC